MVLNQTLHPDCQLTNIDHTLAMMDFDGSGSVNINEFFEVRLIVFVPVSFVTCMLLRLSVFWMRRMARWMEYFLWQSMLAPN